MGTQGARRARFQVAYNPCQYAGWRLAFDAVPFAGSRYRVAVYTFVLNVHGLLRWVVLLAAAYALGRAYRGWLRARTWSSADRRAGMFFSSALDLQALLGIVLAFVSPLIQNTLFDLQAAMQTPHLRFFLVEHVPLMLAALVLVHIGSGLARRAGDDRMKHRRAALLYTLATLAIIVAVPWWRPALPGLV